MTIATFRLAFLLRENERFIYPGLFFLFALFTIPGISWGLPEFWHPDELVFMVDKALHGELVFDEYNFDYPSLPKYIMYGVGKVVYGLRYSQATFILTARILSVLLGAATVVLVYLTTRIIGRKVFTSLLAAFFVISSSEFALNARFAHNDLYLTFFASLATMALIKYKISGGRLWLYFAFLSIGFAASSKYNGASLLIVPVVVYLFTHQGHLRKEALRILETLFIGLVLSALGYAIGTPRALLWMAFYIKRVIPALTRHATYGRDPESVIGLFGQWGILKISLGTPVFILFLVSLVWFILKPIWSLIRRSQVGSENINLTWILILSIISLNLPTLLSYNYQTRFFLPLIPLFAILSALFVEDLIKLANNRSYTRVQYLIFTGTAAIVLFSLLRAISVAFLFQNDARNAAGEYLNTLPSNTSIEYTLYPPNMPANHFSRTHSYPIFFKKFPDQSLPKGIGLYKYNQGEAGLDDRQTDFFVIDSFTYGRFENRYICENHRVECEFFKNLQAGKTQYRLIKTIKYTLPAYLPQVSVPFVNPEIQIYQKLPSVVSSPQQ